MHNFFRLFLSITLGVFLISSAAAVVNTNPDEAISGDNTIHWYNFNIAPGGIPSGLYHKQGIGYLFYKEYVKVLPEYEHKLSYANVPRIEAVIERPTNSCIAYIFRLPKYSEQRHWGPINHIAPPNMIITRQSVAAQLVNKELSLSNLLEKQPFRLGVMAGRGYRVPAILDANKDNPRLFQKHTSSDSIYRMIQSNRLDYTLGDWIELAFMEKSLSIQEPFVTFPMKETMEYTPNFVSCTRNAWGKKIVDKLKGHFNNAETVEKTMLPHIMRWIRDSEKERYRKEYTEYLGRHFGSKR